MREHKRQSAVNKRMKRRAKIMALILSVSMVLSLAACGGGKDKNSGSDGTQVTIVVENADLDLYKQWFGEFEKEYAEEGYTVNPIPVGGGQIQGKQDNMMAAGTPPDIIVGGDVHILSQYKYLVPLDDLIQRDKEEVDIDDFMPEIMNELKQDGKTYYMPNFFNTSLLYYNKTLFDMYNANPANAQITYPQDDWTYDNFMDAAKKLSVKVGGEYSQWGCYSTIGWWGEWLIHIRQAGGEIMNEEGFVTLDTPEAKAGFQQYMDKMYGDNKVSYVTGEQDLGGFTGKKTAMLYGGHVKEWGEMSKVADLNWDVVLLPTVNGNRTGELSVNAFGIHKDSKSQEAAWALIKFLTKKRTGDELKNYPYISPRLSEKEERLSVPKEERSMPQNLEAVYESVTYNRILPQQKYFNYVVTKIVETELQKAIQGDVSVDEALKSATDNANKYIKTNYR